MKQFVQHLGGVFIYTENAKKLAEWYTEHFHIPFEYTPDYKTYYTSYFYHAIDGQQKRCTVFSIIEGKRRPALDFNSFCLNLRVENIEELAAHLQAKNIEVKPVQAYPEGKFTQLKDIDNNPIELWEDTSPA